MLEYLGMYARLTSRILGISYWTAYVPHFMWECVIIVDYYVRYLLDQNISTMEQEQTIKDNSLLLVIHSSSHPPFIP